MTLPVTAFSPKCQITFFTRGGRAIDVTQNDMLAFNTKRSVSSLVGMWDVSLVARKSRGLTLADIIAAMDYVEIRFSALPSLGGNLTMTMRGFVDHVNEDIDASGRWRINIKGRDFGKLLTQFKVYYLTEIDPAASIVNQGRLEQNFGIPGGVISPRQFLTNINERLVEPNLRVLQRKNDAIPDFRLNVSVPDKYAVNGFAIQPFTGSISALFDMYASKPWIESFVDDTPDKPKIEWRWTPFNDYLDGLRISPHAEATQSTIIHPGDIVSISTGRTDNEVYNFFFTYPTYAYLDRIHFKSEGADLDRNPYVDYDSIDNYGFRPLEMDTTLIPSLAGLTFDIAQQARSDVLEMAADLNQWLYRANQHNHLFKNGTMVIKGGGGIQIGSYVTIAGRWEEYYISSVEHSMSIENATFQTTLGLIRGRPIKLQGGAVGGAGASVPAKAV